MFLNKELSSRVISRHLDELHEIVQRYEAATAASSKDMEEIKRAYEASQLRVQELELTLSTASAESNALIDGWARAQEGKGGDLKKLHDLLDERAKQIEILRLEREAVAETLTSRITGAIEDMLLKYLNSL